MDNTKNNKLATLSLCTGYGGLELGLGLAGVEHRTVAYVEIEAYAIANLVAKIEQGKLDEAPIWSNLKTFNAEPFRGKVDIVTGGYPCQPFSLAGERKGTADPRHLFPYIERIISTIQPTFCFFENVEGHLSQGFDEVQASLRDLGYGVEAGLFSASEVGASQQRKRLFILANSNRNGCRESHKEVAIKSPEQYHFPNCQRVAGPGQQQYQGEAPRLISKSELDRAVNGTSNWTDRLRLLGNGVVPRQAAKAFITLMNKII